MYRYLFSIVLSKSDHLLNSFILKARNDYFITKIINRNLDIGIKIYNRNKSAWPVFLYLLNILSHPYLNDFFPIYIRNFLLLLRRLIWRNVLTAVFLLLKFHFLLSHYLLFKCICNIFYVLSALEQSLYLLKMFYHFVLSHYSCHCSKIFSSERSNYELFIDFFIFGRIWTIHTST